VGNKFLYKLPQQADCLMWQKKLYRARILSTWFAGDDWVSWSWVWSLVREDVPDWKALDSGQVVEREVEQIDKVGC